jgi:hypothetical protein
MKPCSEARAAWRDRCLALAAAASVASTVVAFDASCDSPTPLSIGSNAFVQMTSGIDITSLPCTLGTSFDTNFYSFTPSASGVYSLSTCNAATGYQVITVRPDCKAEALACAAFIDFSSCETGTSIRSVFLEGGSTYIVTIGNAVDNFPADLGTITIELRDVCTLNPGTVLESEPCGGNSNAGCFAANGPSQLVSVGDVIQGTFTSSALEADSDWYRVELAEDTALTVTFRAGFSSYLGIVDSACRPIRFEFPDVCPGSVSACLPAGVYFVFVESDRASLPCGSFGEYTLEVTGQPCKSASCDELCATPTELTLGDNPFVNPETHCVVPFAGLRFYNTSFYSFTPSSTAIYRLSSCGTASFDTAIAVLAGCNGEVLAINDDCDVGLGSSIYSVVLQGGETYVIAVGSPFFLGFGSGTLVVEVREPCSGGKPTVAEAEECGDDSNGGCNSPLLSTEPVELGDIIAGSFFSSAALRDTDWYSLSLSKATLVTLQMNSDFVAYAAVVDVDCGGILGESTISECGSTTTASLAEGDYLVVVVPEFGNLPCGSFGTYTLAIGSGGGGGGGGGGTTCRGDLDANGSIDSADLGILLSGWDTPTADLNGDLMTDSADLGILLSAWGPC